QAQAEALAAIDQTGDNIDSAQRQSLTRRWIGLGALDAVEAMLDRPASRQWPQDTQAQLWFELSLGYRDRQARPQQARVLRALIERYPRQPQADKARFLLEHELAAPG
ncbi:rhomboid family intramembrane serine protease, partial [Lysobacter sp. 2RAB21]